MSSVKWKVFAYDIPYVTRGSRQGLLVCFTSSDGKESWGEIAPFPGRSQETLDQALAQLLQLLNSKQPDDEIFPSVQFGLESALSPQMPLSAPLYALLSGDPDAVLKQAEAASAHGYSTVKLKVSSFPIAVAQKLIHTLKERFRIRVDCNSAFSFDEAMSLFSPFPQEIFDYIEDPTYELQHLPAFSHPFALDETVQRYASLPIAEYRNLYGFILKPTVLGGEKGCRSIVEFAQKRGLKIVFSCAFESGLGLLQILKLASRFNLVSDPLGLDTYRHLKQDLLKSPVDFSTPYLTVDREPEINLELLREIADGTSELPSF